MWETWVLSLGLEDPLEKGTATHFSILAWRIRWMGNLACPSPWGRKEPDTTEQLWLTKLTWIGKLFFFFFEWVNADERMLLSILYVNMYRKLLKKKRKANYDERELISCCLDMKRRTGIWEGITKEYKETLVGHVEVHYFDFIMVFFFFFFVYTWQKLSICMI